MWNYEHNRLTTQYNTLVLEVWYNLGVTGMAVAQEIEQVYWAEDWWLDPWLLLSVCQSVLEQHTEPRVASGFNTKLQKTDFSLLLC